MRRLVHRLLAHPFNRRNKVPLDAPEMITVHKKIIESKTLLPLIYQHWYSYFQTAHAAQSSAGLLVVEVGSGASHLDTVIPEVIKTDVVLHSNVAKVARAESLPFPEGSVGCLFLTNVLHHLSSPGRFFREAERVLADGGKMVIVEPANTLLTRMLFGYLHASERWDDTVKEWETENSSRLCRANMAIPAIIFERDRVRFESEFPLLQICSIVRHTCFSYFLSGGVSVRELVPRWLAKPLWKLDCWLCKLFPAWGSQMTIILKRVNESN